MSSATHLRPPRRTINLAPARPTNRATAVSRDRIESKGKWHHPQVYVDVGVIVYPQPRPAFYRYLQAIVDAGFTNRVMFGSDQMVWPGTIERAIAVIDETPFLTTQQKRDIFYNNAARFLRLSKEDIARHHSS